MRIEIAQLQSQRGWAFLRSQGDCPLQGKRRDLKDLVSDAKEVRAEKHDTQYNQAVDKIVSTLERINLGRLRTKQLFSMDLEDEFEISDGETHKLTLSSDRSTGPQVRKCSKLC